MDALGMASALAVELEQVDEIGRRVGVLDFAHPQLLRIGRRASVPRFEPTKLMALVGHSDFATTQGYIDLAGEVFREEAGRLEERLFGTAMREGKA